MFEKEAEEYANKVIAHKQAVHDVFEEKKTRAELVEAFNAGLRADAHTDNSQVIANLQKENEELKQGLYSIRMASEDAGKVFSDYVKKTAENLVDGKLAEAREIIKNLLRVTYGEGWNYSLDWKVKAEQFLKDEGCPDCFCEDCAKDCGIKELGLVEVEK